MDKFERGRKNKDYYEQQLEHTRKMAKTVILGVRLAICEIVLLNAIITSGGGLRSMVEEK